MGKSNYNKVEKLLGDAMIKRKSEQLLEEADQAEKDRKRNVAKEGKSKEKIPDIKALEAMIDAILRDFKRIKEKNEELYEKLKPLKKELKQLKGKLSSFGAKEWEALNAIRETIHSNRIEAAGGSEEAADEQQIEDALKRRKKKGKFYFNVNEKWDTV